MSTSPQRTRYSIKEAADLLDKNYHDFLHLAAEGHVRLQIYASDSYQMNGDWYFLQSKDVSLYLSRIDHQANDSSRKIYAEHLINESGGLFSWGNNFVSGILNLHILTADLQRIFPELLSARELNEKKIDGRTDRHIKMSNLLLSAALQTLQNPTDALKEKILKNLNENKSTLFTATDLANETHDKRATWSSFVNEKGDDAYGTGHRWMVTTIQDALSQKKKK